MPPRGPRADNPNSKLGKAVAWFRANGPESSLRSCSDALGISHVTAAKARKVLIADGTLKPGWSANDPRAGEYEVEPPVTGSPPTTATARPASLNRPHSKVKGIATPGMNSRDKRLEAEQLATTMDQALTNVLEGTVAVLTPEQTMQFLSEAVRLAPTIQLKTMVIRELNKARAAGAEQESLGPGPPLTPQDRIHRAALILQACGTEVARQAWAEAFFEDIAEVHDLPHPAVDDGPLDEDPLALPGEALPQ